MEIYRPVFCQQCNICDGSRRCKDFRYGYDSGLIKKERVIYNPTPFEVKV